MADIESNIDINIETGSALANIRALQREISAFHTSMAKGGAAANAQSAQMQQNLINTINATGTFSASMRRIATTTETFTNALERNKLSMGEYFRYAGAASGKFGKTFVAEMSTIDKVARERVKDLQTQYIKLGRDANGAMRSIAVRPLALDMENLATKTALLAQKQQLFNQLVSQGSTNLLNFGKNTQWAGRQLMVGFTIPLAMFGAVASKSFMDLEKETIKFKKVYGDLFTLDTEKDQALADIEDLAKAMTKYGVTITDTIALASEAAAAGFAGESLKAQTEQATRLSVLGQIETQKALETTIALQSAFRISNEDLAGSINFLNAVENQTVLSLDDVTTAIPKVAPVIQQLGGDVKDLAFFLAAMKEGGINASEGANALKSGLASMINPTKQSSEMLAQMGININAIIEGSQGDLKSTVVGFAQALDQLDPLSRARAIEQLFGKFQFARISALFSNVIRDTSQASRVLDLAGTSLEELSSLAEGELGIVADATSTKFAAAMERIKLSIAPIGEEFLKLVTPIIEFGSSVLESFNNLDGGFRQFVIGTVAVLGGIAPVAIMTFGLLANGAANAIKGLLFLRNTFLRAGGSSQILGQQVDYMTQQQIESSAVAASLGQTHSQLTQIFTSEAGAVDALTAAMNRGVAAQRAFSGPIVPAGPVKPKGFNMGKMPGYNMGKMPMYNNGVVMVPGSGNKDTEPAMLTPGEAVIPAPMAKKYAPLISAMISGGIPGYNSGKGKTGGITFEDLNLKNAKSLKIHAQSGIEHINKELSKYLEDDAPAIAEALSSAIERGVDFSGRKIEEILTEAEIYTPGQIHKSHLTNPLTGTVAKKAIESTDFNLLPDNLKKLATVVSNLVVELPASINMKLKEGGVSKDDFIEAYKSTAGKLTGSAAAAGVDVNSKDGARLTKALEDAIFEQIQSSKDAVLDDAKIAELTDKALLLLKDENEAARILGEGKEHLAKDLVEAAKKVRGLGEEAGQVRLSIKKADLDAMLDPKSSQYDPRVKRVGKTVYYHHEESGKDIEIGRYKDDGGVRPASPKSMPKSYPGRKNYGLDNSKLAINQQVAEAAGFDLVEATAVGLVKGVRAALKIYSPSLVGDDIGEDFGDGVERGARRGMDDAERVGEDLTNAQIRGSRRASRAQGAAILPEVSQSERIAGPRVNRRVSSPVINTGAASPLPPGYLENRMLLNAAAQEKSAAAQERAAEAIEKEKQARAASAQGLINKFSGISYAITGVSGALSMFGGEFSQISSVIFGVTSAFSGLIFAAQALTTAKQKEALQSLLSSRIDKFNVARGARKDNALPGGGFGPPTQAAAANAAKAGGALGGLARGVLAFLGPWGIVIGLVTVLGSVLLPLLTDSIEDFANRSKAAADAAFNQEELSNLATAVGGSYQGSFISGSGLGGTSDTEKAQSKALSDDTAFLEANKVQIEAFKNLDAEGLKLALVNLTSAMLAGGVEQDKIVAATNALLTASGKGSFDFGQAGVAGVAAQGPGGYSSMATGAVDSLANDTINPLAAAPSIIGTGFAIAELVDSQGKIDAVAASTAMAFEAASAALSTGQISLNQYNTEVASIVEELSRVPENLVDGVVPNGDIMDRAIDQMSGLDDATKNSIKELSDLKAKWSVLEAIGAGADAGSIDEGLLSDLQSTDSKVVEDAQRELNKLVVEGNAARAEANRLAEEEVQIKQRSADIVAGEENISAQIEKVNQEAAAFAYLTANGYSAAEALDVLSDSQITNSLAAAILSDSLGETTGEAANFLSQINALRSAVGKSPVTAARASVARSSGGGGSGGPQASGLDDILSKMNKVVSVTTQMTKGWAASRTMLDKLFGGSRTTGNFGGLEQQMRNLGAGEPLIDLIAGMPAEEFEKRKNELFVFDRKGNIRGFRDSLASIGEALRKIALGEFQNKQKATVKSFNDQMVAINKLVAAGASYADAYDMVQDAALANAIANEKNSKSIQQIVKDARAAEKALKDMAAAQAVAGSNEDFVNQQELLARLQENNLNLSNDQIEAILESSDLQRLFMDPSIDPGTLEQALNDVAARAQIELEIKKLTIEGMESIFDDGFSKAMEAFSAKEQQIEIEFTTKSKPFEDIIRGAEEQISDLTNSAGGLDDLEADLERIGFQEDEINKKYDERKKALDSVKQINSAISAQQKSQLTLADALSQGDIAAAARAAQEMREQMRQKSIETQEKALDRAREAEHGALIGNLGLTREQIEARILEIKKQILEIEEGTLEPGQRRIELLDREKQTLLDSITVLGMTKLEWEAIKNGIDLAKTSSDSYKKAIRDALGVVTDIVHYWDKLDGKKVETVHIIRTEYKNVGSPPSAGNVPPGGGGGGTGTGLDPSPDPKPPVAASPPYKPGTDVSLYNKYVQARSSKTLSWPQKTDLTKKWTAYQTSPANAVFRQNFANVLRSFGFPLATYPAPGSRGRGGGRIAMNSGGLVPGIGNSDTISAMLTPGEFVIRKPIVNKIGKRLLERINRGEMTTPGFPSDKPVADKIKMPGFNDSPGRVTTQPYPGGRGSAKDGQSVYNYDININVKSDANPDQIARAVMKTIRNVDSQRIRGSIIG